MKKFLDILMWFAGLLLFYWILSTAVDYADCRAQGKRVVNGGFNLKCE